MWTTHRDLDRVVTARVLVVHGNAGVECAAEWSATVRVWGGGASWGSEFDADVCHVGLGCG